MFQVCVKFLHSSPLSPKDSVFPRWACWKNRKAGALVFPINAANGVCNQYRVHAVHTLDKDRSKFSSLPLKKKKASGFFLGGGILKF